MTGETGLFEPKNVLDHLHKLEAQDSPHAPLPDTLPLSAITPMAELFQPRGMDQRHISSLKSAIGVFGKLEPVLVIQLGGDTVLLDGHHRLAAYEAAGVTDGIPVAYFEGTVKEAVLAAGTANSRAKLPMTSAERMDFAWRLVLLGGYSKNETRQAAGVSEGSVATMRKASKALGDESYSYLHWFQALDAYHGLERPDLNHDELEEKLEALAQDFADRLSKEFGTKMSNNVTLAARSLEIYFGNRLPELAEELSCHVAEPEEYDDF